MTSANSLAYKITDIAGLIAQGVAYYAEITKGALVAFEYALDLVRVGLFDPPKAIQGLQTASFVNSSLVITDQLTWVVQTDATTFRIWRTTDGSIPAYGATPNPPIRIMVHDAALTPVTKGGKTYYEFNDTSSLVNAQNYTYTIYPVNPIGVGPRSSSSIVAGDVIPPQAVTGIQITTSEDATNPDAILTWANPPDSDFKQVTVVRKSGINNVAASIGDGTTVYTGTAQTYRNTGLGNGLGYTYTIFASDFIGNLSKASKNINLVGDITPPGPITGLKAENNKNPDTPKMTLTWQNPTDKDLTGVVIMRRKTKEADKQPRTIDEAKAMGFEVVGNIEYHH